MDVSETEMRNRQHPVKEDLDLQRKIWRFERVGWYLLLAVVVLTLCGLFSRGLLSSTQAVSSAQNLTVDYERFHRNGSMDSMVIHAKGLQGRPITLLLNTAMMDGFSVESMQPLPIKSLGSRDGIRLTLETDKQGEASLYITWRSDGIGIFKSLVGIDGGDQVSFSQFIYP
jgi:hypothetical protein